MIWVGYFGGMVTFLWVVFVGLKVLMNSIIDGVRHESFGSFYGRLWLTLLLYFSPLLLVPLIATHYPTFGLHVIFSLWFAVFSLVCIAAAAIRFSRMQELQEDSLLKVFRTTGSRRWRAGGKILAYAAILGLAEQYATGIIKNALYEDGHLSYRFSPQAAEMLNELRGVRRYWMDQEISSCEKLRLELSARGGNNGYLQGSKRYEFQSGGLWASIHYASDVGEFNVASLVFNANQVGTCELPIDFNLAVSLSERKKVPIAPILEVLARMTSELHRIEDGAPLGFLSANLFGLLECLDALKIRGYEVDPEGLPSEWLNRVIFWGDVLVTIFAFVVIRRTREKRKSPG